jgi:hypothetical protein
MEIRILVFLGLVMFQVVVNTAAIFGAYRLFAGLSTKLTKTATDIRENTEAREWISSMQIAAARAAAITETTKRKMVEFDPVLDRTQEGYRRSLVTIDSKLETTAEKITTAARNIRDTIAKPAFAVATFAAGMTRVLEETQPEE